MTPWYHIHNVEEIDSPALLIYKERVVQNIAAAIAMVGNVNRLRPHIKTCKNLPTVKLMLEAGFTRFKCATIAEAEMLGTAAAPDVLLAYQPVGPKMARFFRLITAFPATQFSCVVDDEAVALQLSQQAMLAGQKLVVYIDVNTGMNRTGLPPEKAAELYQYCNGLPGLNVTGIHHYDGHLHTRDLQQRTAEANACFKLIEDVVRQVESYGIAAPVIIAGGTPTFSIHARRTDVECSPGTFVYWDRTYETICPEQPFVCAALVLSRVISRPGAELICADLGHKSIAAENSLDKRVYFLNEPALQPVSQSEEHLVLRTTGGSNLAMGDVLYGVPNHICPTVALYEKAMVVEDGYCNEEWPIIGRNRRITI